MALMNVILFAFLEIAIPATASFGAEVVFKSTDRDPAIFSFPLPPNNDSILPFVVNPSGEEVFHLNYDGKYNVSSHYKDRIVDLQFKKGTITFSLKNVTPEDAGIYSCRQGAPKGPVIPDCGQKLRYTVEDKNASEGTTSLPDKETATGTTTDMGNTGSPAETQTSNTGAITGGVLGGVVLIAIALIVVIVVWWKRTKKTKTPAIKIDETAGKELQLTHPKEPDSAPHADDADGANAEDKLLPIPNPTEQKSPEADENVSGQAGKDDKGA